MAKFTPSGKKRFAASIIILVATGINTALSTRVNYFQDFFFVADKFPLIMSVVTMVIYSLICAFDFIFENAFIARPPFYIGVEVVLSIFWLAFNAFSTSRWRHIPLECNEIPEEFDDERKWCRDLQALKSFVWIEFLLIFLSFAFTLRFTITQHSRGQYRIWRTALSRFSPTVSKPGHSSEFLQYAPTTPDPFGSRVGAERIRNPYDAGMKQHYQEEAPVPAVVVQDFDALAREPYYTSQPQAWNTYGEGVRDSTVGGPGLAGVGAGPGTPGKWGGFERM